MLNINMQKKKRSPSGDLQTVDKVSLYKGEAFLVH